MRVLDSPNGYVEWASNELSVLSKVEDPPKVRVGASTGLSLGAFTASRIRPDGVQEEMGILQFKVDERYRADPESRVCEAVLHLRKGKSGHDDADFVEVVTFRHDGIWVFGTRII